MSIKILGYVDLDGSTPIIRSKSQHKSLINKRKQRLDEKGRKAIQQAEAKHLERSIKDLQTKFNHHV